MAGIHRRIKFIFYGEVLINLITVIMIFFTADVFIEGFGLDAETPLLAESLQWFASLLVVISYIMLRALMSNNDAALRFVLEGYLIGDFVYLLVLAGFVNATGTGWTASSIFALVITLILIISRVVYLWSDYRQTVSA